MEMLFGGLMVSCFTSLFCFWFIMGKDLAVAVIIIFYLISDMVILILILSIIVSYVFVRDDDLVE